MSVLNTIANAVGVGKRTPEEIREEVIGCDRQIAEVQAGLQRLQADLPLDDLKQNVIPELVRKLAEARGRNLGRELCDGSSSDRLTAFHPAKDRRLPFSAETPWTWGDEAAVNPQKVAERIILAMELRPYESGLPVSERPAERERLTKQLAEVKAKREALVDEHNQDCAAGGELFQAPEVANRRREEEEARKRSGAGDRPSKEAAANRVHHAAQAVRNPYFEQWAADRRAVRGE